MAVSKELLDSVKLYCKIDFDFEDDIIKEMIESAQEQICFAIEEGSTEGTFKESAKFALAVKKQVKEEYDHRGLSADSFRYPLANGVLNIIHQLRLRGDDS
ncbi:TPA: phage head-tail connector protein [Streptococcus pyogenes]|nr:phage head-tail connector protein [Streptococcus pyogenes]HEP6574132.1 phage head-tail connector protein [Streptococcus pyogenes]HEP7272495.1 phage head-tail connector protein [Streptococcus pyogenes]HEP7291227.1 phage head-tail connector protein [Streptococcus pyogenes]HEP7457433.1 phage head-tail connector protein [Streptococcus pyogenes]